MQSSHALKHENQVEATWISICTFSRLFILGFIHQYAQSFEGLSRLTTPFGGNVIVRHR